MQSNYTFANAFTNAFASSAVVVGQPSTLRDFGLSKTVSPFNVTHAFKVNWIYELPFGRGQMFGGGIQQHVEGRVLLGRQPVVEAIAVAKPFRPVPKLRFWIRAVRRRLARASFD